MKTTRNLLRASAVALAVLVCGCATPESRIKGSPEAFARLTPDQQALVRQGQVAQGFDRDAVRLALGEPDRVVVVTNAGGQHEIWHYIEYGDGQRSLVFDGFYNAYSVEGGPFFWAGSAYYEGYPGYRPGFGPSGEFEGPRFWSGTFFYGPGPGRARDRIRVIFDATGHVAEVRQAKT